MRHNLILLISTLQSLTGILCNTGGHSEHAHGHHHSHGGGGKDLEDLIQNFGIAVLGKDQESADDVQPTADHSHVNIKALIDELFHPSSTTTTTTTTPATTSTQRLPIKSHELGWELSPIDLVMANSVLEPVFSNDQRQRDARGGAAAAYLTETPYLASQNTPGLVQPPRSGKSLDFEMSLESDQLIDKPTLPVLDTRRANFLLVNGRKRSKTGRKLSNNHPRPRNKDRPRFGQKTRHQEKKKCQHEADDILWRETVSHQNFITTSPHSFIPRDESSTETPMSDISPFLLPPALSDNSDIPQHQHSHDPHLPEPRQELDQEHHQDHHQEHHHRESPIQSTIMDRVREDVTRGLSRKSLSGFSTNKKGKFFVRGKIRFKNKKKSGRSSGRSGPQQRPARRRGKKSDDNHNEKNHRVHQHLSDDEVEDVIFQDTSSFSPGLRQPGSMGQPPRPDKESSQPAQAAQAAQGTNNKNFLLDKSSSLPVNEIHSVQDDHIHHTMMMSVTRSSASPPGDCRGSGEGLHADTSSGCQRFYMCHENGRSGRFTCPVGTLFSQTLGVCDWARRVTCPVSRLTP